MPSYTFNTHTFTVHRVVAVHYDGIDIVDGYTVSTARSSTSPGPGWTPVPGQPRQWQKLDESHTRVLNGDKNYVEPREFEDYPIISNRPIPEPVIVAYNELIDPLVRSYIASPGGGRFVPPKLHIIEFRDQIVKLFLPLMTDELFNELASNLWSGMTGAARRSNAITDPAAHDASTMAALLAFDRAALEAAAAGAKQLEDEAKRLAEEAKRLEDERLANEAAAAAEAKRLEDEAAAEAKRLEDEAAAALIAAETDVELVNETTDPGK